MPAMSPAQIRRISDPVRRAIAAGEAAEQVRAELADLRAEAVWELRDQGWSYAQIGEAIGVSRGRAEAIAKGRYRSGSDV